MDTMAMAATGGIAFVLTALTGIWMIPFLRKLKYGQTILDIGPKWHKAKQGTPTMGGLMFIVGIVVAVGVGYMLTLLHTPSLGNPAYKLSHMRFISGVVMALAFGAIGFLDDYIKVVKKQNMGLSARNKMVLQLLVGSAYLLINFLAGDRATSLLIPFFPTLHLGLLYYPFMLFIIVGVVNAVNLTDGIDGLAGSVTMIVGLAFIIIASMLEAWEMNLMALALSAGCLGFLVWNMYPAKVFMGDTGSLFLGGMVVALAFGLNLPIILVLVGIIYMVETLSVIIQVISFKLTGKRVFKMSPIHHHFELCGYSEVRIVTLFSIITAVGCGIAIWSIPLM